MPPNKVHRTTSVSKPKPDPTPTTPPLSVVSEDPLNGDDLGVWVFPSKIPFSSAQLAHASALLHGPVTDLADYFFSLGGYAKNADTQLVLQNDSNEPVSILDLRVIKNCGPPLTGTLFDAPPQGSDDDVRLGFDLDSADTDAEAAEGWDTARWKPDYFESKYISFRPGEQRVLNIRAVTSRHACIFSYQATVLEGKTKFYQTIDDGGQKFRVTALVDTSSKAPFARYAGLYAGGVLTEFHHHHGEFVKEDPKTYPGSG